MRYLVLLFTAMFLFVLVPVNSTEAQSKGKSPSIFKPTEPKSNTTSSGPTARAKKYLRALTEFFKTDEFAKLSKGKNKDALKARIHSIGIACGYSGEGKSITRQFDDDLKAADHGDKELIDLLKGSAKVRK